MAPDKSPAFQFYVKDFLSDARQSAMSLQEAGAYIRLLCAEWNEQGRGIPDDAIKCARMVSTTTANMKQMWSTLRACFQPTDYGTLIHPRLQKEREKQDEYRRRQSEKGRASAAARQPKHQPEANRGSTEPQPKVNSPISYLLSPNSVQQPSVVGNRGRPLPGFARLRIFRWMADELISTLGDYSEQFDLEAWLQAVDQDGRVYPEQIWPWLKTELVAECRRRGYVVAEAPQAGKLTTRLASAMANIKASGE